MKNQSFQGRLLCVCLSAGFVCFMGKKHILPLRAGQQLLVEWYLSQVREICSPNPLASGSLVDLADRKSLCEGEVGLVSHV